MEEEAMRDLVLNLPTGTVREALAREAVDELARKDPLAALEWGREAGLADAVAEEVYNAWASEDPTAALEHIAANPDVPEDAWQSVVQAVFHEIPEKTAQVVDSLPAGPVRDKAMSTLVRESLEVKGPVAAAEWAVGIGDKSSRREAVESILHRAALDLRLAEDPEVSSTLREVIAASSLAEEETTRWLGRIETEFGTP
jgi:hypothetical protein